MSSFFMVGMRGEVTACTLQYLWTPYAPPSRAPTPDSFHPLWGSGAANRLLKTSLTLTAPASSRRATRSPRSTSRVHTVADRPYGESFAIRTASSSSATFITGMVGPKVSSVMQDIEWSTSTSTVGAKKLPTGPRRPPVTTRAPASTASRTCRSAMSTWLAVTMAPTSSPLATPCDRPDTLSASRDTNSS